VRHGEAAVAKAALTAFPSEVVGESTTAANVAGRTYDRSQRDLVLVGRNRVSPGCDADLDTSTSTRRTA
jgi:hypothetical protein